MNIKFGKTSISDYSFLRLLASSIILKKRTLTIKHQNVISLFKIKKKNKGASTRWLDRRSDRSDWPIRDPTEKTGRPPGRVLKHWYKNV